MIVIVHVIIIWPSFHASSSPRSKCAPFARSARCVIPWLAPVVHLTRCEICTAVFASISSEDAHPFIHHSGSNGRQDEKSPSLTVVWSAEFFKKNEAIDFLSSDRCCSCLPFRAKRKFACSRTILLLPLPSSQDSIFSYSVQASIDTMMSSS